MTERAEQTVKLVEWNSRGVQCTFCRNEITWGVTLAGAKMPLENAERVGPLLTRAQRKLVTVRYAYANDRVHRILVTDTRYEEKLVAQGRHMRDEIVELWELPASLTHFPHCPARRGKERP